MSSAALPLYQGIETLLHIQELQNLKDYTEKLTQQVAIMTVPASNGKTVLITGINGYIASVLGAHLLAKGYSLRGTSRKAASAEPLLKGPYAPYADRIRLYEVPDMTVAGAFDEAVKGAKNPKVSCISHVLTSHRSGWHFSYSVSDLLFARDDL